MEARSFDAALPKKTKQTIVITLLLGKIALTQPGGVLGHFPVEKQMIVPLSTHKCIVAECCGSYAG